MASLVTGTPHSGLACASVVTVLVRDAGRVVDAARAAVRLPKICMASVSRVFKDIGDHVDAGYLFPGYALCRVFCGESEFALDPGGNNETCLVISNLANCCGQRAVAFA